MATFVLNSPYKSNSFLPKTAHAKADKIRLQKIAQRRVSEGNLREIVAAAANLGEISPQKTKYKKLSVDANLADRIKLQMIAAKREAADQNLPFDEAAYLIKLQNKCIPKTFISTTTSGNKVQVKSVGGNSTPPRRLSPTRTSPYSPVSPTPFQRVGVNSTNAFALLPPPTEQSKSDLKKVMEMAEKRIATTFTNNIQDKNGHEVRQEEENQMKLSKELAKISLEVEGDLIIEKDRAKIAAAALKRQAEASGTSFDEKEYIRVKVDEKRQLFFLERQRRIGKRDVKLK